MRCAPVLAILAALTLAGCDQAAPPKQTPIKVTSAEQQGLHKLDALNLAIALKRAIYDAGLSCKRVTDAGFVATYQNLDMWTATCTFDTGATRDFAIFAGPDGSAQVRDCKDIDPKQMPACTITKRPAGKFDGAQ
ncbi:MAG: hypothetical protein ABIO29_03955 [Sphingomicrobium sp.]